MDLSKTILHESFNEFGSNIVSDAIESMYLVVESTLSLIPLNIIKSNSDSPIALIMLNSISMT